ncbi:hypothetical protein [Pedobacter faecalis]|uniref:hypothetical protein n=1 Tax=Pedobacter faecalis TaxID=3041495 RepID=UPI002550806D|nr:hypothetical protein [Pedobacter sp. ELA7]
MKSVSKNRSTKDKASSGSSFVQMIEDKKRIVEAIKKGEDVSKLKGIKFAFPI